MGFLDSLFGSGTSGTGIDSGLPTLPGSGKGALGSQSWKASLNPWDVPRGHLREWEEAHAGEILEQAAGDLAEREVTRVIFLVDTSGSMSSLTDAFRNCHERVLNQLADAYPNALTTCWTFSVGYALQYADEPIDTAPALGMKAYGGTDLPNALVNGVHVADLGAGDVLVVITDGDVSGREQEAAKRGIGQARSAGVKHFFLVSGDNPCLKVNDLSSARVMGHRIGYLDPEIFLWSHDELGLTKAFDQIGDQLLLLGAAH